MLLDLLWCLFRLKLFVTRIFNQALITSQPAGTFIPYDINLFFFLEGLVSI
jgi:hypothetical protein